MQSQLASDGYQQGQPPVNWYAGPFGGINLTSGKAALNQGTEGTEFSYLNNFDLYQQGSLVGASGNVQLNTGVSDNTAIIGIGAWMSPAGNYCIYAKASGKYYTMPIGGGAETLISSGRSGTAVPTFVNFQGAILVFNGVDSPWQYNGTVSTLTNQPTAWATNVPYDADVLGSYVFACSKDGVFWCDSGNANDWVDSANAGSFTNQFTDATYPVALQNFGNSITLYTSGNRCYSISGTNYSNFTVVRYNGNRTVLSKLGTTVLNRAEYFFSGEAILPLEINQYGTTLMSPEADISYKIKAALTTIGNRPVDLLLDQTQLSKAILLTNYYRNYIVLYFMSNGSTVYDSALVYSMDLKAWTLRQLQPVTFAAQVNNLVYTGTASGQILQEFVGTTRADGINIQASFKTAWLDFNRPDLYKNIGILHINATYTTTTNFTINIYADYNESISFTRTLNNTNTYVPASYGYGSYGVASYGTYTIDFAQLQLNLQARAIKIEFISNDTSSDLEIYGIGIRALMGASS